MKLILLRKIRLFYYKPLKGISQTKKYIYISVKELRASLSVKSSESDHRKQQFDRTDSFTRIERYFLLCVCCARETPVRAMLSRAPGHTDKPSKQSAFDSFCRTKNVSSSACLQQ